MGAKILAKIHMFVLSLCRFVKGLWFHFRRLLGAKRGSKIDQNVGCVCGGQKVSGTASFGAPPSGMRRLWEDWTIGGVRQPQIMLRR